MVLAVTTAINPSFLFSKDGWRDLFLTPSILVVLAVGQAIVIITRNVDLSVGSVMALIVLTGVITAGRKLRLLVDADDLMAEMTTTAKEISEELGKLEGYSDEDKTRMYNIIGLGALKYYILKVDPKKRILFDPKESVDFAGNTGPFIQYTYARIQSLLRKAGFDYERTLSVADVTLHEKEKELLKMLEQYPAVIQAAAEGHSPALVANYTYDLVKEYNSFYQSVPVLGSEVENEKIFRVQLSKKVGETIKLAFGLLGIGVPIGDPALLEAASARATLVRMLTNLKAIWAKRGEHGRLVLRVAGRDLEVAASDGERCAHAFPPGHASPGRDRTALTGDGSQGNTSRDVDDRPGRNHRVAHAPVGVRCQNRPPWWTVFPF